MSFFLNFLELKLKLIDALLLLLQSFYLLLKTHLSLLLYSDSGYFYLVL